MSVCVCMCGGGGRGGTHLSCEGDGTGLTLGADARRPGRMALTTWPDLATKVLQRGKLSSGEEKQREREYLGSCVLSTHPFSPPLHHPPFTSPSPIYSTGKFADIAVEGEMLDGWVDALQVTLIPWFQRNTVDTLSLCGMATACGGREEEEEGGEEEEEEKRRRGEVGGEGGGNEACCMFITTKTAISSHSCGSLLRWILPSLRPSSLSTSSSSTAALPHPPPPTPLLPDFSERYNMSPCLREWRR